MNSQSNQVPEIYEQIDKLSEHIAIEVTNTKLGTRIEIIKMELKDKLPSIISFLNKSKWETDAYKKGYIDGGINQLTTNGDKR